MKLLMVSPLLICMCIASCSSSNGTTDPKTAPESSTVSTPNKGASNAQWIQTNGPYGGNISCFAVSGTNLFARTDSGVFLSTNNGRSWTTDNNGLTNIFIQSLAVSSTNLFAGTRGDGVWTR